MERVVTVFYCQWYCSDNLIAMHGQLSSRGFQSNMDAFIFFG